ncbi:MAG: hypothetical protein OHK0039_00130 [Bacteroidia bacterium]
MCRILLASLLLTCACYLVWGQIARPPAYYGGDPLRVLDLRDPAQGTFFPPLIYDYTRQNPTYRSTLPQTRKCTAVEVSAELQAQYSEQTEVVDSFEQWMEDAIQRKAQQTRSLRRIGPEEVYTLPVVVHVIYSNSTENISDEQVRSQIEVLRRDYRRQNTDQDRTPREFKNQAADTGIDFCLAGVDPAGNPTNGINRVSIGGSPFDQRYINEQIKPLTIWDPDRYLNIWVCNIAGGVLGFAQFPVSSGLGGIPALPATRLGDGVVINYNAFGTLGTAIAPFNRGRTTTHEVGHWLGLRHIWGDGPCGVDDYCNDTPETADPNYACSPGIVGCDGSLAMTTNFMDYSDDVCMNLFTRDQRTRMRTVLENSPRRRSLLESNACKALVSPPEPGFLADVQTGCGPLTVQFTDASSGQVDTYAWFFPGGKPSQSGEANPVVVYKKPGIYPVSLRVSNAGGSRSVQQESFIRVLEEGRPLPYIVDFEEGASAFPPQALRIYDPQQDYSWTLAEGTSGDGKGRNALVINHYDNNLKGSLEWLITPMLDLSSSRRTQLSFKVAYAPYDGRYADTLGVFIATDCGSRFANIYYRGGNQLATAEAMQRPFAPTETEWRTEVIDLSAFDGASHVQVAFVTRNGYGNDLYLDDIRLAPAPAPKPVADFIASDTSICTGDVVQFTDRSQHQPTRWVWTFPGGVPASDTTATPQVSYAGPGTYDVLLTTFNAVGSHSTTRKGFITVKARPELRLTASAPSICAGEPVTLTATGRIAYTWELGPDDPAPKGNSVTLYPASDMVYAVSGSEPGGCTARATAGVRVKPTRSLEVTPPTSTICQGGEVALSATGANTYQWAPAQSLSNANSGYVVARPKETTVYTVTGTTIEGCVLRQEVRIVVEAPPTALFIATERQTLCPGQSTTLSADGAASYRWSPADGLNRSQGATVVASPVRTTEYEVVAENTAGCQAKRRITVAVAAAPQVRATVDKPVICPGEQVRLSAAGAATYRWTPGADLFQQTGPTVLATPVVSTTFVVEGISEAGCSDTASVQVALAEVAPVRVEVQYPVLCQGGATELRATGAQRYTWFPVVGLDRGQGAVVTARPQRDQVYTVRAVDAQGCTSEAQATVRIAAAFAPQAAFEADKTLTCAGQEVRFSSLSEHAVGYYWEFPTGTPSTSTEPQPTVRFDAEGLHDVVLTVTGCNGQQSRQEAIGYIVTTTPFVLRLNTGDRSICRGEPFKLVASGGASYTWSPAAGLDRSEGAAVLAQPTSRTTYTVTATDRNGCRASRSVTLDLIGTGSKLGITPRDPIICLGDAVTLRATGAAEFFWFPQRGLDRFSGATVVARPTETTTYLVESTDLNGCVFRDSVKVSVRSSGALAMTPAQPEVCPGAAVSLQLNRQGVYRWTPAYGLSSTTGVELVANPRTTTTYTVRGTDEYGCPGEMQVTVRVKEQAPLTVSAQDPLICTGEATLLTAQGTGPFVWSPAVGLDRSEGAVVTARPAQTTTYTVRSAAAGCSEAQSVTIEVRAPRVLTIEPAMPRICAGESVQLTVQGGKAYLWDDAPGLQAQAGARVTVRPSQTTHYVVHALDSAGCETSGSVTVQVSSRDFLSVATASARICAGEEVLLRAAGGEAYSWETAPGLRTSGSELAYVRPDSSQIYVVTARNAAGCRDTAALRLDVGRMAPDFEASAYRLDLALGEGQVQFADQTPGAQSWKWDFGNGSYATRPDPQHIFTAVGSYPVVLEVSDGVCTRRVRKEIVVVNSSSLDDIADAGGIGITPEAEAGRFALALNSPRRMMLHLRLLDDSGHELLSSVLRLDSGSYRQLLDLRTYPRGTYHLQLSDGVASITQDLRYP